MATPLEKWIEEIAELTKPEKIHWCDGSEKEARELVKIGIEKEKLNGNPIFSELNKTTYPDSYLHRSHPNDVARTENLTFVCHPNKEMAGPNNNWMDPKEAKAKMLGLYAGCMKGKTMYVMPYMMGHPDSPYAKACVQVTDSVYVAVSMRIMTRLGGKVVEKIGSSDKFVKGVHSVGELDPNRRYIMHFPDEGLVMSYGSGYGGNALLGKKCFSLRIASYLGLKEGWLAEHMIIMGITGPDKKTFYVAAALPSACGKTNLAMMQPTIPGYTITTLGDDIAWMNVGPDGQLYAINPEYGFFGVASGTSMKTNPNMMKTLHANKFYPTLYTNVGLDTDKNEPWWEGMSEAPKNVIDWQGKKYDGKEKAAHANSRFTVSIRNCETLSPEEENPKGVPISAIIFGGRRSSLLPLVYESKSWQHGVFSGSIMGSETTAAAAHAAGVLRRDPMAMLPFCGYNMGDYFFHWLEVGKKMKNAPKIFFVNWFRTNEEGKFMWPGFGENIRVMKWILERAIGKGKAKETPIGSVPTVDGFDMTGLDVSKSDMEKLFRVNIKEWGEEIKSIEEHYKKFGATMPKELLAEYESLVKEYEK
ncbi:MAG: phosphoenolpyruvate carboxykinase [Candidatus Firestonebacteria bacterium RIFOXYA2_FULL_40_8]|nr:MAG: phosphoenolpyruvate carboxykinase [Candidatus Firestonebacteria bacterium RIFOXYA2_FULL_40_8]